MPRNEEGEYELMLGNRQLLSVFVIIVVLLGIFFAMGYITGKNSASSTVLASKVPDAGSAKPQVVVTPNAASPHKTSAALGDMPATDTAAEQPASPGPAASSSEPPASKTPARAIETTQTDSSAIPEPEPGQSFLQVTAVARHDAEILVETLNKRGFSARVAPGSKGLYRVLVGPAKDAADMARLRTSLEDAGFQHPIVRKY